MLNRSVYRQSTCISCFFFMSEFDLVKLRSMYSTYEEKGDESNRSGFKGNLSSLAIE